MNWGNFFKNEAIGIGLGAAEGLTGVDAVGLYKKYRSKKSLPHVDSSAVRHMGNDGPIEAPATQPMTGIVPRPVDQMYPVPAPYPGLTNPYAIRPRMMAKGGKAKPGELIRVGDATGDPNAMEDVYVHPDGSGVTVSPLIKPDDVRHMGADTGPVEAPQNIATSIVPRPIVGGEEPVDVTQPTTQPVTPQSNIMVAPNRSDITAAPTYAPTLQGQLDQAVAKRGEIEQGVGRHGLLRRIAEGALAGLANGGIGGALSGALISGVSPKLNERYRQRQQLAEQDSKIKVLQGEALANAQTQNIYDDNARATKQADALDAYRTNTIEDRKQARLEQNVRALAQKKTFSNKNPADVALAKAAGKTDEEIAAMGSWDISNPVQKTIGDTTFSYDRQTGEWNPVDALKEPSESVDLYAYNPDGTTTKHTFNLPKSKAANIVAGLQRAGMQIEAAGTRQDKQLAHDDQKQNALNAYRNAYLQIQQARLAAQNQKDAQSEQNATLKERQLRATLQQRVKEGKLDQADVDAIFGASPLGGSAGIELVP